MASAANTEAKVRLTVRQFEQILDTGVFEGRHVELLGGELFEVTKNPPHDFAVLALAKKLEKLLPEEHGTIREEKAIQNEACYDAVEVFDETVAIALVLGGQEYGRIAVKDTLPTC